jgi:carbon-monoxide dehydrogenase medium subunit
VIPASFDYVRASSAGEAASLLAKHGEGAKLLAGGHSLLPLMRLRLATPSMLIDLGEITGLSYVRSDGDSVAIGALTRHCDVASSAELRRDAPLLAHVASQVGDPQVRHRGTLGGSLAHGDPASDLPAALLALRGSVVVTGPHGTRQIEADALFVNFLETSIAPDEVMTEVRVPKMSGASWSFQKFNRRAQDWAIVGCVVVRNGSTGVALVNMGAAPMRASAVERALGEGASDAEAALFADEGIDPPADLNASSEFRRHLSHVLVRRALAEARH